MNTLELTVSGNTLSLGESVFSTSGSVNYDKCSFTFDEEWTGYECTAVFGMGRDTYRVPLDEDGECFIPSPCLEKEGIITIGVFGTNDDTVIATNAVSHRIEEGVEGLGEWFQEDYSLVLNAISHMEGKVWECINELNSNYSAIVRKIRRNGNVTENKITADSPDEWYTPKDFEGADKLEDIIENASVQEYLDYRLNGLWDEFPNYIHRERIGSDSSGELPVYAYIFEPLNYEKTMLVTAGVHGCEDMAFFALCEFLDELCRRSDEDRTLSYLRSRIKIIVIPIVNPYALANGQTYNENDVDIGYNFPYKWSDCTKNSKGDSAGDQTETQNIVDYAELIHIDKLCAAVDLHTSPITVSGKSIFYPRFTDNCLSSLTEFISRFNFEAESGDGSKGILAPSVNPTLANYLADTYGINACEAIWPDELYGGLYSDENYTKFTEFIGNLLFVMAKNSSFTCRCSAQPFTKYISWRCDDDAFDIPEASVPEIFGLSNYSFSMSAPCILTLNGYVVLNITNACTVKINPLLYQNNSPEQSLTDRQNALAFIQELQLDEGVHVIPVSSVLQAFYSSFNASNRTFYCGDVKLALAFSASDDASAQVQAYSLMLSGTPSDYGKAVEISTPMGSSEDYDDDEIPVQQTVYPLGTYTFADGKFNY